MKKKRVLFYTNLYPSSQETERGIFISQLVENMSSYVDVKVVCPLPWFPKSKIFQSFKNWSRLSRVPSEERLNGVTVYYPKYILIPKISEFFHALLMLLGTFQLLNKIRSQFQPDILVAMWLYPDAVSAVWWAKRNNIPVIVCGRGCDINRDLKRLIIKSQILYALTNSCHITTVSEALKDNLLEYGIKADKIDVIANGVDHQLFAPLTQDSCRCELDLPMVGKNILVVAQLVPVKDHKTLLLALSLLAPEEDLPMGLNVYFIGEGSLKLELQQIAIKYSISEKVHFIGQQSHDLIPIWMGACDLLCLPSIREGRPNVIIESLACGLPVIASDVGGIPELVNQQNGLLFSSGNVRALACAIKDCLDRNWDKNSIAQTSSHLSWGQATQDYLQLIESVLDKRAE